MTFEYGYNMTCPGCPEITPLTSTEYYRQDNDAHVTCAHCGVEIHFGPAVMALRDVDDPVLDDHRLASVAWYHTSTNDHWPSTYEMPATTLELVKHVMPADAFHRARYRHENQALHLGTYEAAIESMLRRMRDQDEGGSLFYLYRVALRRDGLVIEPNWRDENSAKAAQITQADLGDADGIRYRNVHESPGSISLAVHRKAIVCVQSMSLPASALNVTVTPDLLTEVARIRNEIDQIEASRPTDLSQLERMRRDIATRRDIAFVRSPTLEQSALSDRICQLVEDEYLPGISYPVRARFAHALRAWRAAQEPTVNDADYIRRFASMAATLTRPSEFLRLLYIQPGRAVTTTST